MQSEVDKAEVTVGDAVTQRVLISGVGNVEQVGDPVWADDVAWRAFDSTSTTADQFQNGQLAGVRRIERVLVPTQAGQLTLPAAEFSFFDPAAGQYRTLSTEPVQIAVAPGVNPAASQPLVEPNQQTAPVVAVHPDLRPIKLTAAEQGIVLDTPLARQPAFWALWALPVALLAGQSVWRRRQRLNIVNAAALRSQRAAKQAAQALHEAEKHPELAGEAAGRILIEYVGARLQRPVTGLTQPALSDLLLAHGVSPSLAARVQVVLTQSEVGRYAPAGYGAARSDLLADTQQAIDALEQQLS